MTDDSSLRIIGAGFGRTGTSSLQAAFNQLGMGPTYHMREVFQTANKHHSQVWRDAAAHKPVNWRNLFQNYRSTTDFPACCFYKEHMEEFPNAKVVLTVRDFDSWYKSASETIYQAQFASFGVARLINLTHRKMIEEVIWQGVFNGRFEDKEYARKVYEGHIEEVKRTVPEDKLLVYSVSEGWEPLCKFLEVPVPEGDFPRLNDTKEFKSYIFYARCASIVLNSVAVGVPLAVAAAGYFYYKKK